MFVLQYGAERVPKSLSLRGGPDELYWEPLLGVLTETTDGWVLFDTGMARSALDSDEVQGTYAAAAGPADRDARWPLYPAPPDPGRWNWGVDGDPLVGALATVGLAPADLSLAVVSHLHLDHSGGIPTLFEAGVPVAIQADELAWARSGEANLAEGFHAPDWTAPQQNWQLLDGDADLAPGVRVLSTPGHTPGHCSLRVDLADTGTWIFTADATDLGQNLMDNVPCGGFAREADEPRAVESLARLLDEAARSDARLIPGHDQVVANAIRPPKDGHR